MNSKNKLLLLCISVLCIFTIIFWNFSQSEKATKNTNDYPAENVIVLEYWEAEWNETPNYAQAVQNLVDQYNSQNTDNVHVNLTMIPWDNYYEYYLENLASGTEPDVCSSSSTQPLQYALMGKTLNLNPIIESWKNENNEILNELDNESFNYFTYNGTLIGLPFGTTYKVLYYRKDLLEQAGIYQTPSNLQEFTETLRLLKDVYPDKVPLLADMENNTDLARISTFFLDANGGYAVNSDFTSAFSSNNNYNSFQYLKLWYEESLIADTNYNEDAINSFLTGNACFVLTPLAPNALLSSDLYTSCGIITNLSGPNTLVGYKTYTPQAYHAFNTTEHPNECRSFLKWMFEHDYALYKNNLRGLLPLRKSYLQQLANQDSLTAESIHAFQKSKRLYSYPFSELLPFYVSLDNWIYANLSKDILNGTTVSEALHKADTMIEREIMQTKQ